MTTRQRPLGTMTARTPEDVLAMVPVVIGFRPHESLVLLTFGAAQPFHARVDLPAGPDEVDAIVEMLVAPARLHRARQVLLVAYSERGRFADRVVRRAISAFRGVGIAVIDGLRTDGRRWHPVPRRPGIPDHGVPYDLSGHPFAAEAVFHGVVVHESREQLEATLAAQPDRVAEVAAALAGLPDDTPPALEEGCWARALVVRHATAGSVPEAGDLARLLRGMRDLRVRDAAWSPLTRAVADDHVALWSDVVRRAPEALVPAPASLLGFAAWQAGQGALAWCAVDRAQAADPCYSLADLVGELLSRAVPPGQWEGEFDWTQGMTPPGAG